jgi:hypothetical protein
MSKTSKSSKRIAYGFTLNFPAKPFTVKSLCATGAHPQYITAYMRVKNALKAGTIAVAGIKEPAKSRKGRKELLYVRSDAKSSLTSAPVAV